MNDPTQYIRHLLQRAQAFPPFIEPLLTQFCLASCTVVQIIFEADEEGEPLLENMPKAITATQAQELHGIVFWTFTAMFVLQNPRLSEPVASACADLLGLRSNEDQLFEQITAMNEVDIGTICSWLFPEIVRILEIKRPESFEWIKLASPVSIAYSEAVQAYANTIRDLTP
jgi:hypothetical protein